MRQMALFLVLLTGCGALADTAAAGPRYRAHYYREPADPDVIVPELGPGAVFVFRRHTTRCEYPRGFNTTDFLRNINGIPRSGEALLAEGCGTFEPFAD